MSALFIAPHPDDETLWGSYIIMNYKADVAVFVDDKTPIETKLECGAACGILGVTNLSFITKIEQCKKAYQWIFVPYPEGGHKWHDEVSKLAGDYFTEWKLKYYMAYGPDKTKPPAGRVKIPASAVMEEIKLRALACYKSQQKDAAVHFKLKSKAEWLFN